jgi:hypothetical protein
MSFPLGTYDTGIGNFFGVVDEASCIFNNFTSYEKERHRKAQETYYGKTYDCIATGGITFITTLKNTIT